MLAFVLTPVLAGRLADTWGWRSAYYALTVLAVLAALAVSRAFAGGTPAAASHTDFMATHRQALATPGARLRLSASYLWLGWVAGFGAVVAEVASRKLLLAPTDSGLLAGFYGLAVIAGNLASGKLQQVAGAAALPGAALLAAVGLLGFMLPISSMTQLALLGLPWAFGYGCAGPLHHARLSALSARYRGTINSYHASLLNLGIFSVSFALGSVVPRFSVTLFCGLVGAVTLVGACLLLPWRPRGRSAANQTS